MVGGGSLNHFLPFVWDLILKVQMLINFIIVSISWWFHIFFYVYPYLGKIPIVTNIFQLG